MDTSSAEMRGTKLGELQAAVRESRRALSEGRPADAIAGALIILVEGSVIDESKSYQADRDRDRAFAAELERLIGPEGSTLPPDERNRRLLLVAQWLDEGYDGPPDSQVYAEVR